MMNRIGSQVNESSVGRGVCAGEGMYVSDGVAGGVEDVEAAVAEVIEGFEAADSDGGGVGEVQLVDFAAVEVGFHYHAVEVGWVAGEELLFEMRADDEPGGGGEGRHVACVVEVPVSNVSSCSLQPFTCSILPMRPNNRLNLLQPHTPFS